MRRDRAALTDRQREQACWRAPAESAEADTERPQVQRKRILVSVRAAISRLVVGMIPVGGIMPTFRTT